MTISKTLKSAHSSIIDTRPTISNEEEGTQPHIAQSQEIISKPLEAGFSDGVSGAVVSLFKILAAIPIVIFYIIHNFLRALAPRRFKRHSVEGKVVVITGGGSGLGRLLAVRLATRGASVVVWGRNENNLAATCRQVQDSGGLCQYNVVDVTDRAAIVTAAKNVLSDHGRVDILINNAGVVYGKAILDADEENIKNSFDVNILSHFHTVRAFLPQMMSRNQGQLVTISSMAGYTGLNRMTDYCASKSAAVGFADSLNTELKANGHDGITSTLVCPYYIDTGMFSGIRSSIIPILTPEYVADETLDAILMRNESCILPSILGFAVFINSFLPGNAVYLIKRSLGAMESLDQFQGSKKYLL